MVIIQELEVHEMAEGICIPVGITFTYNGEKQRKVLRHDGNKVQSRRLVAHKGFAGRRERAVEGMKFRNKTPESRKAASSVQRTRTKHLPKETRIAMTLTTRSVSPATSVMRWLPRTSLSVLAPVKIRWVGYRQTDETSEGATQTTTVTFRPM